MQFLSKNETLKLNSFKKVATKLTFFICTRKTKTNKLTSK